MKILLVITHGKMGGATNMVHWLAKGLKEAGEDVVVGFGEGEYLKQNLEKDNILYHSFKWLKRTHNPLANLFFIFEIKKFLDIHHFDIVHFNSSNALFGAIGAKLSQSKTKTIFTFHGLSILDPNYKKFSILKIFYWLIFKFLLIFVNVPVFVSQYNFEIAKKIHLTKKGIVIYNGIPEPKFLEKNESRSFFAKKINLDLENTFIIGSIGRLDYAKHYEFLIKNFPEILKTLPNAICIIIGDGPERKKYENLIKKLGLKNKIFLLGEIPNASQYMKGFDLFILPSRYEGLSITLIEAAFAQIPILASDVGGNKEIISRSYIFETNDESYFLEKIKKLKIPTEKNNIFKIEKMVDKYLTCYSTQ